MKHRWLHPNTACKESEVAGIGVYTTGPIHAQEIVAVLGGMIVPIEEIEAYQERMGPVGIQVNEGFFIVPATREELLDTGVFNHSCEPNLGFNDSITLVAIRDIEEGEELVFDYAFSESSGHQEFDCTCKSPDCRKHVSSEDWDNTELQNRYGTYFSPYLRERI